MSNVPLWVWLLAAASLAAAVVVWCALALASICDDQEEHLRQHQRERDALARASERAAE